MVEAPPWFEFAEHRRPARRDRLFLLWRQRIVLSAVVMSLCLQPGRKACECEVAETVEVRAIPSDGIPAGEERIKTSVCTAESG